MAIGYLYDTPIRSKYIAGEFRFSEVGAPP